MNIEYLHHKRIDPGKWNAATLSSTTPLVYGLYEYLSAVCDSQWDALVFNDYEAVFPLPFKRKLGIKYYVQPLFCQQLGAFGSNKRISTQDFLAFIPKLIPRVRLQFNPYFDGKPPQQVQLRTNFILDLQVPLKYNKDCKRNLASLQALPIDYKIDAISVENVIDTFRAAWGAYNPTVGNSAYAKLAKACKAIDDPMRSNADGAFTVSAHRRIDNLLLGAAIFLITPATAPQQHRCLHYVCAGPTEVGKPMGIMHGIMDFVLRKYNKERVIFDFEGSSIPSVASFYKKFGAVERPFWVYRRGI